MITRDEEIIIAQCTPQGSGALALLRLSGQNVRLNVNKWVSLGSGKPIESVASHTIHYGFIKDNDRIIDQVMVIVMDGPKTFTGQDTIEITCHNNPFIIEEIIAFAIKHGARLAQEGEFTKRAFINGKLDLVQAEAINEIIHANTQDALKRSLAQLSGSFSSWIHALEKDLLKALAWSEASFEFLDDEAEFGPQIKEHIVSILEKINNLKQIFNVQQHIRQGVRIALIGSVNAGKSSIFNTLLNQKRAIVTPIAGTTRDTIEAGLYRYGTYITLIDTAGLRKTDDIIEQEGIVKSFEEAQKADIILLVFDGSKELTHEEFDVYNKIIADYKAKLIIIHNKLDLGSIKNHPFIDQACVKFSSLTSTLTTTLEAAIEAKITELLTTLESPFLLNKRHYNLLIGLEEKLKDIITLFQGMIRYELLSYHLKDALELLTELTGRSISEAGMDMVFKEFCVGK